MCEGVVSLLIIAPLFAFGLRTPPQHHTLQHAHAPTSARRDLLRSPLFWAMMIVGLTALGPLRSLTVHQLAYLEEIGFQRNTAAGYVGLAGLMTFLAYIMWGWASDRLGRAFAFTGGALALAGAVGMLFLLRQVQLAPLLLIYALLYALAECTRSSQTTALASDIFQRNGLGLINGLLGGMFGFGAALGPWLVGRLRDQTLSYTPGLFAVLVMVSVSVIGFVFVAARR